MSESRILVLDNDAVRAERTVALLEFMDFNPRWVADANDFDITRHRPNDWMAAIIGGLDSAERSDALFAWLGKGALPPPVMLIDGDTTAFAQQYGLHEANVWPLEAPLRHAQMEGL
ncbi:MAG: AAA family ATPase, partial [Stenotrophomonas maltophilia]